MTWYRMAPKQPWWRALDGWDYTVLAITAVIILAVIFCAATAILLFTS